jgi:DnaJ family protein C protein 8
LLIHPDKTSNPLAPDAFDRLAKAQVELLDEKRRTQLDESIADARRLIIREKKWTLDEPRLREVSFWRGEWQEIAKKVLIDEEIRRRKQAKAQMQEEGRAQRAEEEVVEERKRKREHEQKWEATRDERIGSWRDFQKKTGGKDDGAKKKKKLKVLG